MKQTREISDHRRNDKETVTVRASGEEACPICRRTVRLVRGGHAAIHRDGVGRNCPGSGLMIT